MIKKFIDIVALYENSGATIFCWHVTPIYSLPSILKNGLIPQIGRLSKEAKEEINYIYAFPDSNSLIDALSNWMDDDIMPYKCCLLELTVFKKDIVTDPIKWEYKIKNKIPPSQIRLIVDDIDEWDGNYLGASPPSEWYDAELD